MSQKPIAVVDASVIILVAVAPRPPEPKEFTLRRERTVDCLRSLTSQGVSFVVPAPAITELGRDGDGHAVAMKLFARFSGMRVAGFDLLCANVAATMLRTALQKKPADTARALIKYDAQIAAIAHQLNAKFLVTANARDFRRYLAEVSSQVELVAADEMPSKGQLRLIDRKP